MNKNVRERACIVQRGIDLTSNIDGPRLKAVAMERTSMQCQLSYVANNQDFRRPEYFFGAEFFRTESPSVCFSAYTVADREYRGYAHEREVLACLGYPHFLYKNKEGLYLSQASFSLYKNSLTRGERYFRTSYVTMISIIH